MTDVVLETSVPQELLDAEPQLLPTEGQPGTLDNLRLNALLAIEQTKQYAKRIVALGALSVAAGCAAYPVAVAQGEHNAVVHSSIADVPADFRLTNNGWSSLQLGLPGSYFKHQSKDGIGMTARITDMPEAGVGNVQNYFSPKSLRLLADLDRDPQRVVDIHADLLKADAKQKALEYEANYIYLIDGIVLAGLLIAGKERREQLVASKRLLGIVGAGVFTAAIVGGQLAADRVQAAWTEDSPTPKTQYALNSIKKTPLEGTTASNPALQLATNQAASFVRKVTERQDMATAVFVEHATNSLLSQTSSFSGPRTGETVSLATSDIHASQAMIKMLNTFVGAYNAHFGSDTLQFISTTGDLTTNGTVAEGSFIESEATMGGDTPFVAIAGDHETPINVTQMKEAGMIVPNLEPAQIDGTTILGANDTAQKDFGGTKRGQIDNISEPELGSMLRDAAEKSNPDLVLTHEAYSVMSFLKLDIKDLPGMTAFLSDNGPHDTYLTHYRNDGIANVPANEVAYGHWHRSEPARVVWNRDQETGEITWTLVHELNTAGGAIGNPTVNRFSLPWYPPLQDAAYDLTFRNRESGLVTGYQRYTFHPDGTLDIGPRINVGLPGGLPGRMVLANDGHHRVINAGERARPR